MSKKLLYRNTDEIKNTVKAVKETLPYLQEIDSQLKAINIEYGIKEIFNLISFEMRGIFSRNIPNIIRDEYAKNVKNPAISGIPISMDKFKEMIELPELGALENAVENLAGYLSKINTNNKAYRVKEDNLYVIGKNKIAFSENYEDIITEKYSYYSKNKRQTELAEKLESAKDALNTYYDFMTEKGYVSKTQAVWDYPKIDGLIISNSRLDHNYILRYE